MKCDDFSRSGIFWEFWKYKIRSFRIEGRPFRWLKNFYNNIQAVDTQYYFPSELSLSEKLHINSENFSMIHLNIRSAKKNFEKLKDFLSQTGSFFKVLCLTKIWFDDRNSESSLYQLPQYTAIHQHRSPSHKSGQGGGISMYIMIHWILNPEEN